MGFLSAVAKFLSKEIIQRFGEDVLAEGRRVFAQELARGKTQQEAARLAAKHMMKHAAEKGRGKAAGAGEKVARGVAAGAQLVREKLRRK